MIKFRKKQWNFSFYVLAAARHYSQIRIWPRTQITTKMTRSKSNASLSVFRSKTGCSRKSTATGKCATKSWVMSQQSALAIRKSYCQHKYSNIEWNWNSNSNCAVRLASATQYSPAETSRLKHFKALPAQLWVTCWLPINRSNWSANKLSKLVCNKPQSPKSCLRDLNWTSVLLGLRSTWVWGKAIRFRASNSLATKSFSINGSVADANLNFDFK